MYWLWAGPIHKQTDQNIICEITWRKAKNGGDQRKSLEKLSSSNQLIMVWPSTFSTLLESMLRSFGHPVFWRYNMIFNVARTTRSKCCVVQPTCNHVFFNVALVWPLVTTFEPTFECVFCKFECFCSKIIVNLHSFVALKEAMTNVVLNVVWLWPNEHNMFYDCWIECCIQCCIRLTSALSKILTFMGQF